jgi:hypothetical protein
MGCLEAGALHDDFANGTPIDCELAVGDRWLAAIVASPTYQAGGTAVFILWNDSEQDPPGVDDCTELGIPDCLVPFVVVSRSTTGGHALIDKFQSLSLLRTTEELLGLDSFLGGASSALATYRHSSRLPHPLRGTQR